MFAGHGGKEGAAGEEDPGALPQDGLCPVGRFTITPSYDLCSGWFGLSKARMSENLNLDKDRDKMHLSSRSVHHHHHIIQTMII